jgi:glycosyltransferase involved in cell wall biosynthesis
LNVLKAQSGGGPPIVTVSLTRVICGPVRAWNERSRVRSGRVRPRVLMVTGGGIENGGGVGRMVGYIVAAWNHRICPMVEVIDTRGPKFTRSLWPFFFLNSVLRIIINAPARPLLHVHLAANGSTLRKVILTRLGHMLGLTYIIHLHDPTYAKFYNELPTFLRSIVRGMFMRAARVIVLGKGTAGIISKLVGFPYERIDVVPNAVPDFHCADRVEMDEGKTETRILFLGELQHRKGVYDLIDALSRPQVIDLRWTATLAGGGPAQTGFEEQAARSGLRHRISFPGWLSGAATRQLLQTAAVLVLPSYAEEMAMSVLEGMAFGLCVVCTPVGASSEVIENEIWYRR